MCVEPETETEREGRIRFCGDTGRGKKDLSFNKSQRSAVSCLVAALLSARRSSGRRGPVNCASTLTSQPCASVRSLTSLPLPLSRNTHSLNGGVCLAVLHTQQHSLIQHCLCMCVCVCVYEQQRGRIPVLDSLSDLITRGRSLPVHLEPLARLEGLVAEVMTWKESAAKTFLLKSSTFSLLEVLHPACHSLM